MEISDIGLKPPMSRLSLLFSVLIAVLLLQSCRTTPEMPPKQQYISVYQTKADKSVLLQLVDTIPFSGSSVQHIPELLMDTSIRFQPVEGFGAALTGSSAYVLNRYLDSGTRIQLLKELFTPDGAGMDYLRITIGASDFSLRDFSYNDTEGDTMMSNFSLREDHTDLIPVLKEILQINPDLKIMASPWSAPGWMKTNGSMTGGRLKREFFPAFARYLSVYIMEMNKLGIPIDAISVQNEPLHGSAAYPCMDMPAADQRDFIRDHLGPEFRRKNIAAKILLYDHNWDRPLYADTILQDKQAAEYAWGTAFHAYGGTPSAMSELKKLHPDKAVYFTEISGGRWAPVFGDNLKWYAENIIIGTMQHWSRNALFWNLALDENDGPQNRGCANCRGVVTVTSTGAVQRNEEYYALAHAGKFIRQNAYRIHTQLNIPDLQQVGFIQPDGSKVLLVLNKNAETQRFSIREGDRKVEVAIEGNAFYTLTWH